MWTKIPQMCFRIHFREQNCKTALVEKIPKEPVTFFLFHFRHLSDPILHYYPLLLCLEFWPPPLFLFSWYIQSKKREQGGFRTTIPSFQIFAFNYFLSIFAALFPSSVRVPEKQSHSVFLPSPNSTFLQYSIEDCNTSDFCALKNTLYATCSSKSRFKIRKIRNWVMK